MLKKCLQCKDKTVS